MFSNADEVLAYIKDNDVKFIDVRFCDLPGVMQHFTVPVSSFDESVFDTGLAFDGSSMGDMPSASNVPTSLSLSTWFLGQPKVST